MSTFCLFLNSIIYYYYYSVTLFFAIEKVPGVQAPHVACLFDIQDACPSSTAMTRLYTVCSPVKTGSFGSWSSDRLRTQQGIHDISASAISILAWLALGYLSDNVWRHWLMYNNGTSHWKDKLIEDQLNSGNFTGYKLEQWYSQPFLEAIF